ncbi:hypothetical protein ASG97_20460 [Bacillus sp. Soil745]|nr:hypothetical protein ASG97_20460 [Bacillus sp. Soil745]
MGLLLTNKKIKKIVGENKLFEKQFLSGELEVELVDFTEGMFLAETQEGVSLDEVMEKTCGEGDGQKASIKR